MELWSYEHLRTLLPTALIMLTVSIILGQLLKSKSESIRMIPFQICSVVLFGLEIGKQAVSIAGGYDLYHLPFHYCSLLIFAPLIMSFYRGKHKDAVYSVVTSICSAVSLLTLIYPCLIYSADNIRNYFVTYMDFHTVTFHSIAVMLPMLILSLRLNAQTPKGTNKHITIVMMVYGVIAAAMAHLLKTNFANMYQCNIPPLETVRQMVQSALGYTVAQILYVTIVAVLQVLFTIGAYYLFRLIRYCILSRKSPA